LADVHASQLTVYSVSHYFIECNLIDFMLDVWRLAMCLEVRYEPSLRGDVIEPGGGNQ
jgi:hypothetical protein